MVARAEDLRDRCAVSTLDEAVCWLWTHSRPEEWLWSQAELPTEAMLVCDVFWITPSKLVQRMKHEWSQTVGGGAASPVRHRRLALHRMAV